MPDVVVAFIVLLFCFCLEYIESELNFHGQNASLHICRSLYLLGMKTVSPACAIEICIYFRCTWETDSILLQHFCYSTSLHSKGKELRDVLKPIKCDRKLTKSERKGQKICTEMKEIFRFCYLSIGVFHIILFLIFSLFMYMWLFQPCSYAVQFSGSVI